MHIPAMGLKEDSVVTVRDYVRSILQMNSAPPRKLAALYDRYLFLLSMDKEAYLTKFQVRAETHRMCGTEPKVILAKDRPRVAKHGKFLTKYRTRKGL
jgi:hypothetical protein